MSLKTAAVLAIRKQKKIAISNTENFFDEST